jgi:hypothetical protein
MFEHLCATLLQQSHMCPVPLESQPVFWNYDHALHLYPLPDVLVLADRAPCASFAFPSMPADQADQACICLNPVRPPLLDQPLSSPDDCNTTKLIRRGSSALARLIQLGPAVPSTVCLSEVSACVGLFCDWSVRCICPFQPRGGALWCAGG